MKKKKLGLIGCGWLGKPLAMKLHSTPCYQVTVTSASDRLTELTSEGLSYCSLDLKKTEPLPSSLLSCDIFIYTVPPLPLAVIKPFFNQLDPMKKIIFISSTSVYPKNMGHVNESTPLAQENNLLLETEAFLKSRFQNLLIFRAGGLYGAKRHPVFFLSGKENLSSAGELTHLVHQSDCLEAITTVLERDIWNETINLVSDLRLQKKDYYTAMAKKLSLPVPHYVLSGCLENPTQISNEKSKRLLNLTYLDPNDYQVSGSL